jgi:hypothetical protein
MYSIRSRSFRVGFLVALLIDCGGGGGGGSSQSGTVLNLAGNWQASTSSKLGYNTFLSGTLTQTGNQISGSMTISGSPCALSGMLSGTVSGSSVTLSLTEGSQMVSLSGTAAPDGNSMTGTYQAPPGGCTNGDSGTFTATRIASNSACAPVPPGIVSWWQGEGNAQDATGTNPGVVQGGVTFGPGARIDCPSRPSGFSRHDSECRVLTTIVLPTYSV